MKNNDFPENDPISKPHSSISVKADGTKFFTVDFQLKMNYSYEFGQNLRHF